MAAAQNVAKTYVVAPVEWNILKCPIDFRNPNLVVSVLALVMVVDMDVIMVVVAAAAVAVVAAAVVVVVVVVVVGSGGCRRRGSLFKFP